MKVLMITLLVCAVATIQPAEAQLVFSVEFSEDRYTIQEGNSLTVTVDSNYDGLPQFINVAVHATVVVQEDANCQPGRDLLLPDGPNRTTATLTFNRSHPSDSFNIEVPCDGLVEGPDQRCTLRIGVVTIPESVRSILNPSPGAPAVLDIRECDDDYVECKWEQEYLKVTEGTNRTVMLFSTCARKKISAPTHILVFCVDNNVPGFVQPAVLGSDWTVGNTTLNFTDFTSFDTLNLTKSHEPIIITINDDLSAEPSESLICSILAGLVDSVRTADPKQVTIDIIDNDALKVSWAEELYIFDESVGDALTMLETNSIFSGTIGLTANPRMIIPDVTVNFESFILGVPIKVTRSIDFTNYTGTLLGVGTVGLRRNNERDVEDMNPHFTFSPNTTSSSSNFIIFDDDVYEYDELIMADFDFDQRIRATFNTMKDPLNVTYILIKDDDTVEVCFAEDTYTVIETEGNVVMNLRVTGKYFVFMNVTISCTEGTATNDDFKFDETTVQLPMPFSPSLAPNTTEVPINIAIVNDRVPENRECFTCIIHNSSLPEKERRCSPPITTICIVDPITIDFAQPSYAIAEGNTLTVEVRTNLEEFPLKFDFEFNVTVRVKEDLRCTPFSDIRLPNGNTVTLAFSRRVTTATFNVEVLCDGIVELDQSCTLEFEPHSSGFVTQGLGSTVMKIIECGDYCGGGWSSWSEGVCLENRQGQRVREDSRICTTPDHPKCCLGLHTRITPCPGSWSPWLKGSCSTLPCGGIGVRTDVRLCTSLTPSEGRVHCRGEQWRNTTCFTCPCGGGWSSWSEGVCSENRQGQRVREDIRICTTPDHPECCHGLPTRISPCPETAVHGGWSAWNVGYCSKTCGGYGVRTDWRACNNPPPLLGGDHCDGPASRTMPCYTCPCGGGWSNWVEGTCSKTCGLGTRLDRWSCTTPDHQECCPGCGLRQSNCSVAECPVHGGWSSWLEATSCSVSCGGGTKVLVRECNEPVPAHGGNDCDGVPYRVESCNTCPCNAGWSSWVPGACGAPCGQNGTAIATRKCRGPSECCPGEGKRTEVCTSPPCQGR